MENDLKRALITGGNDGIGKYTAIGLAQKGFAVTISARNTDKGKRAVEEIKKASANTHIDMLPLDLADLQSVRRAVAEYRARFDRLDVLINNAGIVTSALEKTAQGFEMQFGVNHLGHFLLTQLLLDMLEAAPEPRVINVSSHAHYRGQLDFDNLRGEKPGYDGLKAYMQSKLANVLFTREFARRYPRIACNALHPGAVRTRFANKTGLLFSLGWTLVKPFLISVERGAETSIRLASDPAIAGVTGQYFDPRRGARYPSRTAQDPGLALRLWEWSEEAAGFR